MFLLFLLFVLPHIGKGEKWVIELEHGVNPQDFAQRHGIDYVGDVMDKRYHVFNVKPVSGSKRRTFSRDVSPHIVWAEEQVKRMRLKRTVDPLYQEQWHLHGNSPSSIDVDLLSNYTGGEGVRIAIVDDGLQHTHPEIAANYDDRHSKNFNGGSGGDSDPMPQSSQDGHGTSAAAVAVGVRNNGHCGHGVAYAASVSGIRLIAEPVDDADEATALSAYFTMIQIYSNSWGPADTGTNMDAPGRLVRETFARFAGEGRGRGGKGTIYVWASGNGREETDSCAYDGYAGNPYVNAIGAVDVNGRQSWYSEGCSALIAVTPSSGALNGITTADLMGSAGYTPTECTSTFGGTSSAAPLAAGIIALLLEKRPDLSWRDVKHVIAKGATQIDVNHTDWRTNNAGYHHSNAYGFGLLKVPKLMQVLATYQNVPHPQKQVWSSDIRLQGAEIHSRADHGSSFLVTMNNTGIEFIEMVVLVIGLTHPTRGSVSINVISPEGVKSNVAPYHNDVHSDYPIEGWSFSSLHFWGDTCSNGNWYVHVTDKLTRGSKGRVQWIRLGIWGY